LNCRVAFQPTPEALKKLGLPEDTKQLFRKSGIALVKDKEQTCPVCGGSGYFGQIGLFAAHDIDANEQRLIASNDMTGLRAAFRQKKQPSIQQAGLQLAMSGDTSVDEIVRAMGGGEKRRKPQPSGQGAAKGDAA